MYANSVIQEIYTTKKTVTLDNKTIPVSSYISENESAFLYNLAKEPNVLKTLEVGCAHGLSSLSICEALKDKKNSKHLILDPFQKTNWNGCGIKALERAGLSQIHELIEQPSEFALPHLVREEQRFDMIFIDGWHTLDHTLLDCFYATRLLNVGGYLIVDDCDFPGIAKTMKYLKGYPCYEHHMSLTDLPENPIHKIVAQIGSKIPVTDNQRHKMPHKYRRIFRRPNMIALKKTEEDKRKFNWYTPI